VNDARRVVAGVALGLVALAYAWWAVGLPAFSAAATVAVVGAGAVAMLGGSRADRTARPAPGRVLPWLALAGLLAAVQAFAYLQQPRGEHPTLSSLTNAALDSHAARAAAFVGWLVVAVELARR
jgi:hypothetical protein